MRSAAFEPIACSEHHAKLLRLEQWKIGYQAAADHCHDADYATHARRLIECLSDEISWVYYENISFPASVKEVVTGKATEV